jgi:hypothetical protein
MRIDLDPHAKRNLWPLSSGEHAVRPGLRKIYSAVSARKIVGGFSVLSPYTGDTWHYIVDVATSGALDCKIRVVDEGFNAIQTLSLNADISPRVVTHAINRDQLFIASPDFPTVWGWVGGGIQVATPGTPVLDTSTALPIPRGLVCRYFERVVIASGSVLYPSDPFSANVDSSTLRAFTELEVMGLEGAIFGLHTSEGGSLVAVTTAGVYALAADVGQLGELVGEWRKVDHYSAARFGVSALSRGRLFGLTQKGYRLIDGAGAEEKLLDEPSVSTTVYKRIQSTDYQRFATMRSSELGPIVSLPIDSAVHRTDLATGFSSWWTMTHTGEDANVVGVLRGLDGDEMLLTGKGAYRVFGNFDGDEALSENAAAVEGGYVAKIPMPARASPVVRRIDWQTTSSTTMKMSIGGTQKTATPNGVDPVIGTDAWDDDDGMGGVVGTAKYRNAPLTSKRFHFAVRTDEVDIEAIAQRPLSRVGSALDLEFRGQGRERP